MARHSWPEEGQAPDALRIVVKDHGTETLSDGPKLNNVLQDLIPGMRRESSVLVAAADADIASVISARIGQRMSTAAAVAQAADYLEDRTALTTEACEWAARQMARAMGVKVTAPAVIRVEAPTKPAPRPVPMTMGRGADPARSGWLKAARGGGPVAAHVAGTAALASAFSIIFQALPDVQLPVHYRVWLILIGCTLTISALLMLVRPSRRVGTGLVFASACVGATVFAAEGITFREVTPFLAGSLVTSFLALIAAVSSGGCVLRNGSPWPQGSRPFLIFFCLMAAGLCVAGIPAYSQYQDGNGVWQTAPATIGPGVGGWLSLAGLLQLIVMAAPIIFLVLVKMNVPTRIGVLLGWIITTGVFEAANSVLFLTPGNRSTTAFVAGWVFWSSAALAGVLLIMRDHPSVNGVPRTAVT